MFLAGQTNKKQRQSEGWAEALTWAKLNLDGVPTKVDTLTNVSPRWLYSDLLILNLSVLHSFFLILH